MYENVPPQKRTALMGKGSVLTQIKGGHWAMGILTCLMPGLRRSPSQLDMICALVRRQTRTGHENGVPIIIGTCEDSIEDHGQVRWYEKERSNAEHRNVREPPPWRAGDVCISGLVR